MSETLLLLANWYRRFMAGGRPAGVEEIPDYRDQREWLAIVDWAEGRLRSPRFDRMYDTMARGSVSLSPRHRDHDVLCGQTVYGGRISAMPGRRWCSNARAADRHQYGAGSRFARNVTTSRQDPRAGKARGGASGITERYSGITAGMGAWAWPARYCAQPQARSGRGGVSKR